MEALIAAFGKTENIALVILMGLCFALGYAHIVWRREEREDRAKMMETFNALKDALNDLRVAVAAMTGKTG